MIHPLPTNINLTVYDKSWSILQLLYNQETYYRCFTISDYLQVSKDTKRHIRRILVEGSLKISNNIQY